MLNRKGIGGRKKGCIPWNKGLQGIMGPNCGRPKGYPAWNKGLKWPERSGINHPRYGKHFSWTSEQKAKLKGLKTKEKHPNWIEDRSLLVKSEKKHLDGQYREWMFSVKKRDSWKCKINNGDCNGQLESHHILNWKEYPELRYVINNGITLCHAHHPRGRIQEAKWSSFFQKMLAEVQ